MATGTVSSFDLEPWQLVASRDFSVNSATTYTFSGLTGYKSYIFTFNNVYLNTSGTIIMRLNGDTNASSYGGVTRSYIPNVDPRHAYNVSGIPLSVSNNSNYFTGYVRIDNALQPYLPKIVEGVYSSSSHGGVISTTFKPYGGDPDTDSSITSLTFYNESNYTMSNGWLRIYGLAG